MSAPPRTLPFASSIRARVLILLTGIFAGVVTVAGLGAMERRATDLEAAKERLMSHVEFIRASQQQALRDTELLLDLLVRTQDLATLATDASCPQRLAQYPRDDSRVAGIFLVAPDGKFACNPGDPAGLAELSGRAHVQAALKDPRRVIGEAFLDRGKDKWVLPFARRYLDAAGRVAGVAVVEIDLDWVTREFAKGKYPAAARIGLVDARGMVIARYPDPEKLVGTDGSQFQAFKAFVAQGGTGVVESKAPDQVVRLFAHTEFSQTIAGPITLWIGMPLDDVTRHADRQFAVGFALALGLMLLSVYAAWRGSQRWLLNPIENIVRTARRLGSGDFLARTGVPAGEDELSRLANVIDDMAASLAAESELLRVNRALEVMRRADQALVRAPDEASLLEEVCRIIVEVGGHRMAWVGLTEDDAHKTVRPAAQFGHSDGYLDKARVSWEDAPHGRGPTGTAIRTGAAQVNRNFETDPLLVPWKDEALRRGYRSSTALPLVVDGKVLGALTVYSGQQDAFNPHELRLMEDLASDIAFGIRVRRLQRAHDQTQERLLRTLEATIGAVATTVEYRDPYTAGHQRRVAQLAAAIARELGMTEHEIHGIHLAGVVHDIGKIGIPKEILVKPAALTAEEFQVMKGHPDAGHAILKNIDFPWPVAEMVWQHHERLDGSGYPRGLRGEEILPGARILAVADVVEAMSIDRPYRKSPGIDAALAEIERKRATGFDPAVVDACIGLFRRKGFTLESPDAMPDTV